MSDGKQGIRVAIPSELPGGLQALRSGHFGRCECFTLVDVRDGEVVDVSVVRNAPHVDGGCLTPVMALAQEGVDALVVDGIGGRPLAGFHEVGISVYRGAGETVEATIATLTTGDLPQVGLEGACQH